MFKFVIRHRGNVWKVRDIPNIIHSNKRIWRNGICLSDFKNYDYYKHDKVGRKQNLMFNRRYI